MVFRHEDDRALASDARTVVVSSARKCTGLSSCRACVASRRRPSMWYSWTQCSAFSMKNSPHLAAAGAIEVDAASPRALVPIGEVVRAEDVRRTRRRGRSGCRRRRGRRRGRADARHPRARADRPAGRSSAQARTAPRRRIPSCASPGKSAIGISSIAVMPRSLQIGQAIDDGAERAFWRERADVQLVEHRRVERRRLPRSIGPPERRRIHNLRMGHARPCGWKRDAGSGNIWSSRPSRRYR